MTADALKRKRRRRLHEIAREYRDQGFTVVMEPSPSLLPPCLAEFSIDFLARRGSANVLVLVRTRREMVGATEVARLAGIVDHLADWRLDLVTVRPQPWETDENGLKAIPSDEAAASECRDFDPSVIAPIA